MAKVETNKEKMVRCTQNLIKIQNEVGTKEKRFQDIRQFLRKMHNKRDTTDVELEDQRKAICEMDQKSPDFNFDQYKEYCAMKVTRQNLQKESMILSRQICKLENESKQLRHDINRSYNDFKMFSYMKKNLL